MMRRSFHSTVGALALVMVAGGAQAADDHYPTAYGQPSVDAAELAALAPPAPRSTEAQTYGDAQIARAHVQRRYRRRGTDAANVNAPFGIAPCEPRLARSDGYVCRLTSRPGYGEFYAFTPASVTAPQVPRYKPDVDEPLLPRATAFFLSANNYLFGTNN